MTTKHNSYSPINDGLQGIFYLWKIQGTVIDLPHTLNVTLYITLHISLPLLFMVRNDINHIIVYSQKDLQYRYINQSLHGNLYNIIPFWLNLYLPNKCLFPRRRTFYFFFLGNKHLFWLI